MPRKGRHPSAVNEPISERLYYRLHDQASFCLLVFQVQEVCHRRLYTIEYVFNIQGTIQPFWYWYVKLHISAKLQA